jgi:hypothetical protein
VSVCAWLPFTGLLLKRQTAVMRVIAWLKSFAVRLVRGGESQIGMASHGKEVIHEEEWSKLPEEERALWEATDDPMPLYQRKPW